MRLRVQSSKFYMTAPPKIRQEYKDSCQIEIKFYEY